MNTEFRLKKKKTKRFYPHLSAPADGKYVVMTVGKSTQSVNTGACVGGCVVSFSCTLLQIVPDRISEYPT